MLRAEGVEKVWWMEEVKVEKVCWVEYLEEVTEYLGYKGYEAVNHDEDE